MREGVGGERGERKRERERGWIAPRTPWVPRVLAA